MDGIILSGVLIIPIRLTVTVYYINDIIIFPIAQMVA